MKKPHFLIGAGLSAGLFCTLFFILRKFALDDNILVVVVCSLLLGCFYLLFYFLIIRRKQKLTISLFILLFAAGLICRLFLFGIAPQVLSDDVYRYLWDGKVQTAGINPYLYAPGDPLLDSVGKGRVFSLINHPQLPTSYPPLAQLFFRFLYSFSRGDIDLVRLVYLVIDFFCFFLIFRMVENKWFSFLYFLSPLVILETFIGLHVDILGVLFMVGALYCFGRRWNYSGIVLFAASVLTKYLFLAAAPVLLFYYLRTDFADRNFSRFNGAIDISAKMLVFLITLVCLTLPFINAGPLIFRQVLYYTENWQFNAPLFVFIQSLFPSSHSIIRFGLLAVLTFVIAAIKHLSFYDRLRLSFLALMLLNGVLYPWYLLWLIPFFAFGDRWGELTLVTLTPLSYLVLIEYKAAGVWEENPVIIALQYAPLIAAFGLDIWKGHYVQKKQGSGYYSGPQRGAFTSPGS